MEPPALDGSGADAGDRGEDSAAYRLGAGFVVWESNRSGAWRIWIRPLDGSEPPRQLSPDERGRHHCCPHVSPDGRRIVYLASTDGAADYAERGSQGELRLLAADGTGQRVIAPSARSYFEDRAAVWHSPRKLVFIAGDGTTRLLDVDGGESKTLVADAPERGGWLINRQLTTATLGSPGFSPYDRRSGRVAARAGLGGCQPYLSHDGRWGFWTGGAGGPIRRYDLATGEVGVILEKNDPRAVDGYGYAYFPMLSRDGLLFAWAASQNQHDHFRSDYEIFVAESDPETLELIGPVVRLTHHPATDRYPDLFVEPLPLGRWFGEAPFTARLEPSAGGSWEWDFGEGSRAAGEVGEHRFASPGRFRVTARRSGETLAGEVIVRPAKAPEPVGVALPENGAAVVVHFDEPIDAGSAQLAFESGREIAGWGPEEDGRSLRVELAEAFRGLDRLRVEGVADRAQVPNRMAPAVLDVEPPLWPSRREGLLFLWQTGDAANLVPDRENGVDRTYPLEASGLARLDHGYAMLLGKGAFVGGTEAGNHLRWAAQRTNAIAVEAMVTPDRDAGRTGRIVALSRRGKGQDFRLSQRGGSLYFQVRTGNRGPTANPEIELFEVPPGRSSHVVVGYAPGRLVAWRDGELRVSTDEIQGDFFHWRTYPLVLGDEWGGGGDWSGTLEGVAIYDRLPSDTEVRENYLRYRELIERRAEPEETRLRARLLAKSKMPTLAEITPYREALVVFEYEVLAVEEGELSSERVRVAHWALLAGERLAGRQAAVGSETTLVVEPFDANPQLEGLFRSDDVGAAGGARLLYAPQP